MSSGTPGGVPPFPQLVPTRLSDRVAGELLRAVVAGLLPVGTPLPSESELARRFGVSRLTIREAVQALQARGVVQSRQGSVAVIADGTGRALSAALALATSWRDGRFGDVLETRGMLDRELTRLAAGRRTPADVDTARRALAAMRQSAGDRAAYAEAHADFHQAIAVAAHNQVLLAMADAIRDLLVAAMQATFPAQGATAVDFDSHQAIADAVAAGAAAAALAATEAHLTKANAAYAQLAGQPVGVVFSASTTGIDPVLSGPPEAAGP
jgi:GntR family transcriptional repressor for pyruvate dehydrogenase complex